MAGRSKLPQEEKRIRPGISLPANLWKQAKNKWHNVSEVVERLLRKELEKEEKSDK